MTSQARIELPRREFLAAAALANMTISRHPTAPILTTMRVQCQADGGKVVLAGTDIDNYVEAIVGDATGARGLDVALPEPRALASAVKQADGDVLGLRMDGTSLTCGALTLKPKPLPGDEMPALRTVSDAAFSACLSPENLAAIARVMPAISTEETRYYLNGIHLHAGANPWAFTAVATNGHLLFMAELALPDATGELPASLIIPRRPLAIARALSANWREQLDFQAAAIQRDNAPGIELTPNAVRLGSKRGSLVARTIDGTFPDYTRVLPTGTTHLVTFETAALRRALAMVTAGKPRRKPIALTIDKRYKTRLEHAWLAGYGTQAEASVESTASPDFPDLKVGLQASYLDATLAAFAGRERVTFGFSDAFPTTGPITVDSPDDCGFRAIIMPMRI